MTSHSLIPAPDLAQMLHYAATAPNGAFVEVGVYKGGSARELYGIAERQGRTLWLFDTFTGHPAPSEHDGPQHPAGRYADCADPDDLQREMPDAAESEAATPAIRRIMPTIRRASEMDLFMGVGGKNAVLRSTPLKRT